MKYTLLFLLGFLFACSPKVIPGQCYNNSVKVTQVYTDSLGIDSVTYVGYPGETEYSKSLATFKEYFSLTSCFDYETNLRLNNAENYIAALNDITAKLLYLTQEKEDKKHAK